ncbi:hypothetical protein J4476_02700 [Candidatus Woesearchaeota archaeon]|nr:hypothetical protein [Candidatus Woesearchaeota archaeon]HIH26128.1 hypothetical protein [Nanoarchaeota archaeon]
MESNIRKNILDLSYNKYLQYLNACIVLFFTYLIGILIAFLTKQLSYSNNTDMIIFFAISVMFLVIMLSSFIHVKSKMKNIIIEIESL